MNLTPKNEGLKVADAYAGMSAAGDDFYGSLPDDDGELRAVSSGTSNRNASTSRSPRSTPKGRSERLGGSHNPSYGEEDGRHVSTARDYRSGSDDDDSRRSRRRTSKDRDRRAARRKVGSEMDLALLSDNDGGDDDTSNAVEKKPSRLIPSSPVVTEGLSPTLSGASVNGRHQLGDAVQARFGGRSRWFAGKVERVHEGPTGKVVYGIGYDDGDKEDGVLAGRVRSPGQTSPPLRASLAVEVKLARKGKGYHPATIGRVNDDGSLYVKLEDGDSEWSASPQQIIPLYPYEPAKAPPGRSSDTASPPEPLKHDSERGVVGGARKDSGRDGYGDAEKINLATGGKQVSNESAVVVAVEEEEDEGATKKTTFPSTDSPVPTHESVRIDKESLTGTALSNPATTASTSPGSTPPTHLSVFRNSGLVGPESISIPAVVASAPPPDDEQRAGGSSSSRVVAASNPGERSIVKSTSRTDGVESPYGGGLGGITGAVKKSVGGSTVLSPGAPGTASPAGRTSLSLHPKTPPDAAATSAPPPDAAAGYVDVSCCGVGNKPGLRESAQAPAHPGLKPIAGGASSGSAPASASAARAAVYNSVPADTARASTSDGATEALSSTRLERNTTPEGSLERKGGGISHPGDGTGGGQAETEHREISHTPSSESASTHVDATATAEPTISPTPQNKTSNPTLVSSSVVDVVGAPDPSGSQVGGSDDTTFTAGKEGARGVAPATEHRTGREKTPQQPSKIGSGGEAVPRGEGVCHGGDRRGPGKPDAAQRGGADSSRPQPLPPDTAVQPDGSPVGPLKTAGKDDEKGEESVPANHGTSSLPPPPPPLSPPQPGSRDCGGCTRRESLRVSVQRRYAAEAMHLSEEVRLLKAKLGAADGQLQAKLAQQERRFGEQMQETLQRERDKAQALLGGQRAASARRISALNEELQAARRQLDLELNNRTKTAGARTNSRGRVGSRPSLRPASRSVPLNKPPRRDAAPRSHGESESASNFTAIFTTAQGATSATGLRPDGIFTTAAVGVDPGTFRPPPSLSRPGIESRRGEGPGLDHAPKISSLLGCGDGPGGSRPTATAGGDMDPNAPTPATTDTKLAVAHGLTPESEVVDFLAAGLAATNQSVGELEARLENLERERDDDGALLGAGPTASCRVRLADEGGCRNLWSDRVVAVDRGKSADTHEKFGPLPSPSFPTRRRRQKTPDSEEVASMAGKKCGGRSHEGSAAVAAAAAASASDAAVPPESGDAGDLLIPVSRPASGSNPAPVKRAGNPGNVNTGGIHRRHPYAHNISDVCNESPGNINTGVSYKHPHNKNNINTNAEFHCENLDNNRTDVRYEEEEEEEEEEDLRWKLEAERRNARERLKAMKGELERIVGQFRARAERAEAAAASAEKRAAVKAFQYLRSKRFQTTPASPPLK